MKAPTCWTLRDTPPRLREYYNKILIPQPFEPNYDPLLTGVANADLYWDGAAMFDKGIEITGMDPVDANDQYNILISNWRIDWSQPSFFGEYTHAGRDLRQAYWFINRDPVVFKVNHGRGYYLICQLRLAEGGDKGKRLTTQLLTGLGCSIGTPTGLAAEDYTFDSSLRQQQLQRFVRIREILKPVAREFYGLSDALVGEVISTVKTGTHQRTKVFLIGDVFTLKLAPYIKQRLTESDVDWNRTPAGTSTEGVQQLETYLSGVNANIVLLNFGLEDLKLVHGQPAVSREVFTANLRIMVEALKKKNAKIYWTNIIPISAGNRTYAGQLVSTYNDAAARLMGEMGVYVVNLNEVISKNWPAANEGGEITFTDEQLDHLGVQIGEALTSFGAIPGGD